MKTLCCKAEVIKQGRATWLCSECFNDVSMMYIFYMQAINDTLNDKDDDKVKDND